MFINYITDYLPEVKISNEYFFENFGITNEEIILKSGINNRRYTKSFENTNTMAIEAVKKAFFDLPYSMNEIDLIIGATYTPYDTVGSLAHEVQKQFNIVNAKCFTVDSACSSFVNALEIVECYFANKKATKALIVVSENNSAFNDKLDVKSNFLWGDGASAIFISKERYYSDIDIEVIDINTTGLGHVGKSIEAITLRPNNGGLKMPYGKDVFQYACTYMIKEIEQILIKNDIAISQLDYFISHQANSRITDYIIKKLNIKQSSVLSNIQEYGNTGSASTPIVLSQNITKFIKNDIIVISVFGGGYSSGSVILKKI